MRTLHTVTIKIYKETYFKSIEEALPILRPCDKIHKVLSNKFAYVKSHFTNGTYDKPHIMGLDNEEIYSYLDDKRGIEYFINLRNIEPMMACFDHSENGKPNDYVNYNIDNRRIKRQYRKLKKLLGL